MPGPRPDRPAPLGCGACATGAYTPLEATDGLWAYRRGDAATVVLNLSGEARSLDGVHGRIAVASDRARDGEAVDGTLALGPWEGAVVSS